MQSTSFKEEKGGKQRDSVSEYWLPFEDGKTIGTLGSEGGSIVMDLEHVKGARVTLERECGSIPFAITIGIYGLLFHTHFEGDSEHAERYVELKKAQINTVIEHYELPLESRNTDWSDAFNLLMDELSDMVGVRKDEQKFSEVGSINRGDSEIVKMLVAAFGVVLGNVLLDHFFAPFGMMLMPIALTISASIAAFSTTNLNVISKSFLVYGLVALQDIGIKLYGGGSHDSEGQAWIHMMLFISFVPTFVILVLSTVKAKEESNSTKISAILIFLFLLYMHFMLFKDLGLGRYYWYHWNG
ncbi:MAG: hypothetical protein CFE21_10105 [Bacteroidetes bacterium B1(2017)]|nr:MAG: hypothetical protein CFE21_10105 [Bacteroidetes bacterium B1(2017)]